MKLVALKKMAAATPIVSAFSLSACTTDQAIDTSVGVAAGTAKVGTKSAVGAGKLAYKGSKALIVGAE